MLLRLLLGLNSICRFRVAAVTIVPGFCRFFRTLWSCVCFLWRPQSSGNSGTAASEIGALGLDAGILSSDGISACVLVYSGVNPRWRRVRRTRRERDCGSTAGGGEHCKSRSEGTTGLNFGIRQRKVHRLYYWITIVFAFWVVGNFSAWKIAASGFRPAERHIEQSQICRYCWELRVRLRQRRAAECVIICSEQFAGVEFSQRQHRSSNLQDFA